MEKRVRTLLFSVVTILVATAALAQVDYQPTPPPSTFANDRDWYRNSAPIPFAGEFYYPSGPTVYFNGDTMVPTGAYDGVTLYADTTIEAYRQILVPVTDKILRPYERARQGRGRRRADVRDERGGWNPPPPPEQPYAFESVRMQPDELILETVRKPQRSASMSIVFQGYRWELSGDAVALDAAKLSSVGTYHGFTIYADPHAPYVVYLPSRDNLVAPFRRAEPQ